MNVSHKATARLLVAFFFVLASAVFVWPQDSDSSSRTSDSNHHSDIEEIISRGELRVAITEVDQPPFYFMDKNGKLSSPSGRKETLLRAKYGSFFTSVPRGQIKTAASVMIVRASFA